MCLDCVYLRIFMALMSGFTARVWIYGSACLDCVCIHSIDFGRVLIYGSACMDYGACLDVGSQCPRHTFHCRNHMNMNMNMNMNILILAICSHFWSKLATVPPLVTVSQGRSNDELLE